VKLHIVAQNESLRLHPWQLTENSLHVAPSLEEYVQLTVEAREQDCRQNARVAPDTTGSMDCKC